MESNRIIELIQNPEKLEVSDKAHIEEEIAKYPFAQSFQTLQFKWKQFFSKREIDAAIEKLSIYSTHRELIKQTLNQPSANLVKTGTIIPKIIIEEKQTTREEERTRLEIDNKEEREKEFDEVKQEDNIEQNVLEIKEDNTVNEKELERQNEIEGEQTEEKRENKFNISKLGISHLFSKEENIEKIDNLEIEQQKIKKFIKEENPIEVVSEVQEIILETQINSNSEDFNIPEEVKILPKEEVGEYEIIEEDNLDGININKDDDLSEIIEDSIKKEDIIGVVDKVQESVLEPQIDSDTEEGGKVIEEAVVGKSEEVIEEKPIEEFIQEIEKQETKLKEDNITSVDKLTFNQWLFLSNEKSSIKKEQKQIPTKEKQKDIIGRFIENNPKISTPKKETKIKQDIGFKKEEIQDIANLMTITLAELYIEQGKYDTAMTAFKILSLKYPEKSSYFALKIREIKKIKNSK